MNIYIKNKTRKVQKSILLVLMLLISLMPVNVMAENNSPVDTIKASRDINDEEIYFLEQCSSSNINIGDEIAWLDSNYTDTEFTSVGVPSNSGIVRIVKKPEPSDGNNYWEAYYPEQVNFYLDVLKSGKGFDGCIHGTLNHNVTEYNCWWGGVQHLKGKAYTFVSKPFYSKVTFNLNINGASTAGKDVKLFDGTNYFTLTDKGNGVYSNSKIYIGNYSVYVDGKPVNLGVNVEKTPYREGHFSKIDDNGNIDDDVTIETANSYYSGHEYVIDGNFYDYNISVKYNGELSDDLGKVSLVTNDSIYNLVKTGEGTYIGTVSLPKVPNSKDISIYVGNIKTETEFQTTRTSEEAYKNNDIEICFYDSEVTAHLDNSPMSGYSVSFNNGVTQYYGKTDVNGVVKMPIQQLHDSIGELDYTVKVEGTVDNTGLPITLSFNNKEINLYYHTVSFFTGEKNKEALFRKQIVRDNSLPNKVANAPLDGYVFDFWSETQWEKDKDSSTILKYDFSKAITAAKNVYAHATKPTVDIYDTYIGTDFDGEINTTNPEAFRMPAVTISGFPKGYVLKCFNLELTNIEKVYFYNTDGLDITQVGGSNPVSENNGLSTTANKVTVSFSDKLSMAAVENYIRENVVFVPIAGQTATIKLTVSDGVISVEDTSIIEQSQCTDTNWKKLSEVSNNTLNSGYYYVDKDITKTASAVNTNGLVVKGSVYLYIPAGKTLTAKGYGGYFKEGSGSTLNDEIYPGTAGILLLQGNSLYVYGKGKLSAYGGNAGDGSNGYNASTSVSSIGAMSNTGFGGRGGSGAGAGIGTNGAALDPQVDKRLATSNFTMDIVTRDGNNGYDGPNSKAVTDEMGALYIAETVTVDAHGGAAGNNGTAGGNAGENKVNVNFDGGKISVGAGGGGGAGYGGHAGANIGKGGATGASGGNGGAGGLTEGNKSGNAGGGGKGAVNGSGTQSGTGGAGGKAGADTNPVIGESITPLLTSINDGHEFNYTIVFNGSEQDPILYFMDEKTITVPDYANVPTGKQFMGWKVKTYGKTLETASSDNPLTTAEDDLYQPGSTLTIKQGTYGNIVLVPVLEDLPTNAASDELLLTTLGNTQLYKYTLKVTNNGEPADLGTFVFHDSNGNKYNVNSGTGDNLGTYTLTLTQDITISSITATDLDNVTIKNGNDNITIVKGETKQAVFSSIEVGVTGKIVGDVKVNNPSYNLTYNGSLSTNNETVFSYFTQLSGAGDSTEYAIVIDGEEIPTSKKAKFGTRATVNYSTINVNVSTNVDKTLNLYLKNEAGKKILFEKGNNNKYSAIGLQDNQQYTLYINDYETEEKVELNVSSKDLTAHYYEINIVSKVDNEIAETNHEIKVNDKIVLSSDNKHFKTVVLSNAECKIKSNGIEVTSIIPSSDLDVTDINYYTVEYVLGTDCLGTVPVDNTLYLNEQEVTVASFASISSTSQDKYVAAWKSGDNYYNEGDQVTVNGPIVFTSYAKKDNLVIEYVDKSGNSKIVNKLPLAENIVVKEWSKTDWSELVTSYEIVDTADPNNKIMCYLVGWRLRSDENKKVYKTGETTVFTPEELLGDNLTGDTLRVYFDAVYSLSKNPFTVTDTIYNGVDQTPTLSNNYGFGANDYEIVFEQGVDHKNARDTIPFKVHFKSGKLDDIDMTFNIKKCPITITPNSGQSKTYRESEPTLTYTVSPNLCTGDTLTGALSREDGENVGTYNITLGNLQNDNYDLTLDNTPVVFTINPKSSLTNANLEITGTYTYTGSEIEPTFTVKDGTKTLEKGTDYTVEYSNNTNANTNTSTTPPTVKITLKGNYSGTLTGNFTIGKATINPTILLDDWTYGDTANVPSVDGNSGNGVVTYQYKVKDADDDTYSNNAPTAAGTYVVKATIAGTDNYFGATNTKKFTIKKKEVEKPVEDTTNFVYTGLEQTYTIADNSLYSVSNNKRTDAGTQNVTISLTDKNNYKWKESNSDDLTYTFTIAKATGEITVDTTTITKTFGETVDLPDATSNFGNVTCDKTSNELVNADTYTVTYTLAGTDNYTGDTKTLTVIINKAPINPRITIKSFNKGDQWIEPTISDNTSGGVETVEYKVKDALDSTYTTVHPTEVGIYTAKLTVEETDNYLGATATCDFAIYTNPSSPGQIITAVVNTNTEITDTKLDPISETEATQILGTEGKLGDFAQALTNPENKVTIFTEVEAPSDLTAFEALNITNDNAVLLDINLYAMLNNDYANKEQITDTNGYKTTVSITLTPQQAQKINIASNKNYFVLRLHNNDIEKIPATLTIDENGNYVFTFETDKFSAYAIYSENKPAPRYVVPNTGVEGTSTNNHSLLKLSSLSLLTIGTYLVIKKKKEND